MILQYTDMKHMCDIIKERRTNIMKKQIAKIAAVCMLVASVFGSVPNSESVSVNYKVDAAQSNFDLSTRLDMSELYGYADVTANGLESVTGGGNSTPVIVTTLSDLKKEASGNLPKVIVISGTIVCPDYAVDVGSNKTIVGIDDNAVLYGGFNIKNSSNVIVCNLNVQGTWPNSGPDDCFNIENSHHVWLNHLSVWNSTDGNIDIKAGSDYITVSWCKIWYTDDTVVNGKDVHGHRLSCLIGSGAGDHDATDMGKLHVTYHHNWFGNNLDQRMPRVMYGRAHIYNNYYTAKDNTYCVGADCYASVLIENNSFNDVNNPHQFHYDNEYPASIVARGNLYNNTSGTKDSGQKKENNKVSPFETTVYDYKLNNASDVSGVVSSYAGPKDLSDGSVVSAENKNSKNVKGVADTKKEINANATPLPEQTPVNSECDNPITYDKESESYTYNGSNSDGSQAFYEIKNPFKKLDLSEEMTLSGGYPKWNKGVTISYWVNVPKTAKDAVVLNFNLENDRQIQKEDAYKYKMCREYSASDKTYSLGTVKTYIDANGKKYTVLEGYGKNVRYNPEYPAKGYYYATDDGGAYYAYEEGTDSSIKSNWKYLDYIGDGYYENYSVLYDETGGENSKIAEAKISGSFSMYASGSVGYRQDNWSGLQLNPYLDNYGQILDVHQFNQFYYWGSGGEKSLSGSTLKTPTMKERGKWHFVVAVIQNDWVQYYIDGQEITTDYLTYWGVSLLKNFNSAGQEFNYGYGNKVNYRNSKPTDGMSTGMTILDFISDKDTVLTVGGLGAGATKLGMNTIGTPKGTCVKEIMFYSVPLSKACILSDKIDVTNDSKFALVKPLAGSAFTEDSDDDNQTTQTPAPTKTPANSQNPTKTPDVSGAPTQTPGITDRPDVTPTVTPSAAPDVTGSPNPAPQPTDTHVILYGDVNEDGKIDLLDASESLKIALGISKASSENAMLAADYNKDGQVNLSDVVLILKAALGITD